MRVPFCKTRAGGWPSLPSDVRSEDGSPPAPQPRAHVDGVDHASIDWRTARRHGEWLSIGLTEREPAVKDRSGPPSAGDSRHTRPGDLAQPRLTRAKGRAIVGPAAASRDHPGGSWPHFQMSSGLRKRSPKSSGRPARACRSARLGHPRLNAQAPSPECSGSIAE
jgi:hypothetical protein